MSAIYPTPGHSDLADGGRGVTGPRAARWQWLSGSEVRPCSGAGVAVAVGMAAGEAAAAGVSSAGTVAVGVALAGAGQWSSRSVAAAVWPRPRQQLGSSSNMVYCMENEPAVRRPVSAHVDLHRRFT